MIETAICQPDACLHCGTPKIRSRGLCTKCYDKVDIRHRYPMIRVGKKPVEHKATLPVLPTYPNHAAIAKCEHGVWVDACPQCERVQREVMEFLEEEKEEDAA